MKAVKQNN